MVSAAAYGHGGARPQAQAFMIIIAAAARNVSEQLFPGERQSRARQSRGPARSSAAVLPITSEQQAENRQPAPFRVTNQGGQGPCFRSKGTRFSKWHFGSGRRCTPARSSSRRHQPGSGGLSLSTWFRLYLGYWGRPMRECLDPFPHSHEWCMGPQHVRIPNGTGAVIQIVFAFKTGDFQR